MTAILQNTKPCDIEGNDKTSENFDANEEIANQKNDYDIVLTTEVLAEGVNLHRSKNVSFQCNLIELQFIYVFKIKRIWHITISDVLAM